MGQVDACWCIVSIGTAYYVWVFVIGGLIEDVLDYCSKEEVDED